MTGTHWAARTFTYNQMAEMLLLHSTQPGGHTAFTHWTPNPYANVIPRRDSSMAGINVSLFSTRPEKERRKITRGILTTALAALTVAIVTVASASAESMPDTEPVLTIRRNTDIAVSAVTLTTTRMAAPIRTQWAPVMC